MNTPHNGWTRMEGGGWEVLHVQVGGHGYNAFDGGRDTRRSNRYLRTRATNGGCKDSISRHLGLDNDNYPHPAHPRAHT